MLAISNYDYAQIVFSAIPFLGEIASGKVEYKIAKMGADIASSANLENTKSVAEAAKWAHVANAVRSLLVVAAFVAAIACPIFSFVLIPLCIAQATASLGKDIMSLSSGPSGLSCHNMLIGIGASALKVELFFAGPLVLPVFNLAVESIWLTRSVLALYYPIPAYSLVVCASFNMVEPAYHTKILDLFKSSAITCC